MTAAPTLKSYPENAAVTIAVPLVDFNGDAVTPSAVNYRVTDEAGTELVPLTSVTFAGGIATITVPGDKNVLASTLPAPVPGLYDDRKLPMRGIRVVEVQMTVAGSIIEHTERYIVTKSLLGELQLLVNSFATYDQLLLQRLNMPPKLDGWDIAADSDRVSALQEAFLRITKLSFHIRHASYADSPRAGWEFWPIGHISAHFWPIMTVEQFLTYQETFRIALQRAQIAEADVILNGDIIAERRREGLLSESIGESHMMFRTGKPLELPVSRQALRYLTGYLDWTVRTGR